MRAKVITVKKLPGGRRVAKLEGPGVLGWAFLEEEMSAETAQQMEEIIQAALDAGGWDQNWDWAAALMATAHHAQAS
jgi:hypothetical protein